jgi:DNA-binding LytR/AlgR family response regulator
MVAAFQAMAFVRLDGRADMAGAILSRLSIIPLWALATPLVLRSARRFPAVDREWNIVPASIAAHLVLGSLFIVLSNVLIRIPNAFGPDGGLAWLARATTMGVAEYYPPAMVVYGVIVAIGHAFIGPNAGRSPVTIDPTPLLPHSEPETASAATETIDDSPEVSAVAALDGHLAVRQWNRVHLVRMDEIDFVEAEDNYVVVHAASRAYKGRDRISDVEAQLDSRRFVRIHRSTIVHVAKIREVQPLTHGDHAVVLRDGKVLRVARSRREALGRALGLTL